MIQYVSDGEKVVSVKANVRPAATTLTVCVHAKSAHMVPAEGAALRRGVEVLGEIAADTIGK